MGNKKVGIPAIAVLGYKESGKTFVVESIVKEAKRRGINVATAKHISKHGFRMDKPGKDTWRHSEAGARQVIAVSDIEITVIYRQSGEHLSVERLKDLVSDADILILEGFSYLTLKNREVGKVICVRNIQEYSAFKEEAEGEIIAFYSLRHQTEEIEGDIHSVVQKVLEYIKKKKKVYEIAKSLPGLDCGKCGYKTCLDMAEAIYKGEAMLSDCNVLIVEPKLRTKIKVGDNKVPIQPFVSEIIGKTILAMVSTLKGVKIRGDERVKIEVISDKINC